MSEQHPFWSDDFDMDLLKVFPTVREVLGPLADVPLWTLGRQTQGRLNHPTCWNSHGAYVWLQKPNLLRDQDGWVNINGCIADSQEIECTWLELLRDQWPHGYGFILLPGEIRFPAPPTDAFMALMWDLRGWGKSPGIAKHRAVAWRWLMKATANFDWVMKSVDCRGGGKNPALAICPLGIPEPREN